MGWNDDLINQKFKESFINGFDKRVKLELSKFFKKDYKSIYKSILSTEQMLIENLQKEIITYERHGIGEPEKYNNDIKIPKRDFKEKKYHSYHKLETHSDNECRRNKSKIKGNKQDSHEKISSLQEPIPRPKQLQSR
ncbi:hypothetical protein DMUE_3022 [Dictyocoela muelleri]|nr:hypothetical protein DMUE_3022 [Dictyocoela muelleri]